MERDERADRLKNYQKSSHVRVKEQTVSELLMNEQNYNHYEAILSYE